MIIVVGSITISTKKKNQTINIIILYSEFNPYHHRDII